MTITSAGYDGQVNEVQWAKMIPLVGTSDYGVVGAGDWKVTPNASVAQAVDIAAGTGWGYGVYDTSSTVTTVACPTITSGTRWDLVCVNRNWAGVGGTTSFTYVQGSSAQVIPARTTGPGVLDQQPIALVQWTAGQTQPTAIIDLRVWAGNGSLAAKDPMVLSYLNRVGTTITIGDSIWQATYGLNDTVNWTKLTAFGKIPLFASGGTLDGGVPDGSLGGGVNVNQGTTNALFLVQAGTTVQRTDGSAYARITWPKPFPNGLVTCVGFDGDDWATGGSLEIHSSGNGAAFGSEAWGNRTSWVYSLSSQPASRNGDVSSLQNLILSRAGAMNLLHRINWIAIGW